MTTYKVGYLRRQPRQGVDQPQARQGARPPGAGELDMAEIPFKDLPLYSYDYDADFPPAARAFKDAIAVASTPCCSSRRSTTARSLAG